MTSIARLFLPALHAFAAIDVEQVHVGDQRFVGADGGAHDVGGGRAVIDDEGEVAGERLQIELLERRLGAAFSARRGDRVEENLESKRRRFNADGLQRARVDLAVIGDHFWAKLQHAGAAGAPMRGRIGEGLQRSDRRADGFEHHHARRASHRKCRAAARRASGAASARATQR